MRCGTIAPVVVIDASVTEILVEIVCAIFFMSLSRYLKYTKIVSSIQFFFGVYCTMYCRHMTLSKSVTRLENTRAAFICFSTMLKLNETLQISNI